MLSLSVYARSSRTISFLSCKYRSPSRNMTARGSSLGAENCIFCKIVNRTAEANVLYEDKKLLVFTDRSPAAQHHYLVIPKEHIVDIRALSREDIPLVEEMEEVGLGVLRDMGGEAEMVLTGFHWPIHSVSHLHMHVIAPADKMSLTKRIVFSGMFFGSTQSAIEMLQKK